MLDSLVGVRELLLLLLLSIHLVVENRNGVQDDPLGELLAGGTDQLVAVFVLGLVVGVVVVVQVPVWQGVGLRGELVLVVIRVHVVLLVKRLNYGELFCLFLRFLVIIGVRVRRVGVGLLLVILGVRLVLLVVLFQLHVGVEAVVHFGKSLLSSLLVLVVLVGLLLKHVVDVPRHFPVRLTLVTVFFGELVVCFAFTLLICVHLGVVICLVQRESFLHHVLLLLLLLYQLRLY